MSRDTSSGLCVLDALRLITRPRPLIGAVMAALVTGFVLCSWSANVIAVQLAFVLGLSPRLVESFLELLLFEVASIPLVLWTATELEDGTSSRSLTMTHRPGQSTLALSGSIAGVSLIMSVAFVVVNSPYSYWAAPHWPRRDGFTSSPSLEYLIRLLPPLVLWLAAFLALSGAVLYGQRPVRALRHAVKVGRRRAKDIVALLLVLLVGSVLVGWAHYQYLGRSFVLDAALLIVPSGTLIAYMVLVAVCLRMTEESVMAQAPPPLRRAAPVAPKGATRPGLVTAAAVLMFVSAGVGVLTLIALFVGGFIPRVFGGFGIMTLAFAGFDIWVGILVLKLRETGRLLGILLAAIAAVVALPELGSSGVLAGLVSLVIHGFIIYALVTTKEHFTR
jgi:hypothetical protein